MVKEQASLYRRWNPQSLDDICGNRIAVAKCRTLIDDTVPSKRPGFYLFSGPTGTGKSTLVHILMKAYGCGDIRVFNSRECGKVDFVTQFLTEILPFSSLMSNSRAFIFEEAHNITPAAQEMFMEPLEKGIPANTYVAFVTNSPERLTGGKGALISRPFRIDTARVEPGDMIGRLATINVNEEIGLTDDELRSCAAHANKSVRNAINNVSRLACLPADQRAVEIERIRTEDAETGEEVSASVRELALALEKGSWDGVAAVLRKMKDAGEDPEGLRRGLLAWHSGILLSDKAFARRKRGYAQAVIDALRDNYFNTGFPGLVGDLSHLVREGIN